MNKTLKFFLVFIPCILLITISFNIQNRYLIADYWRWMLLVAILMSITAIILNLIFLVPLMLNFIKTVNMNDGKALKALGLFSTAASN